MTKSNKIFCFIDLETTGLDAEHDRILEVAWVFTDNAFHQISQERTFVVDHAEDWGQAWAMLRSANEFVRTMHNDSGLIADMTEMSDQSRSLDHIWSVLDDDFTLLKETHPGNVFHLAGDSVWFDRGFLDHNTFQTMLNDHVHHRLLDLSAIKVFLESQEVPFADIKAGDHRALNDVRSSLEMARSLRNRVEALFA